MIRFENRAPRNCMAASSVSTSRTAGNRARGESPSRPARPGIGIPARVVIQSRILGGVEPHSPCGAFTHRGPEGPFTIQSRVLLVWELPLASSSEPASRNGPLEAQEGRAPAAGRRDKRCILMYGWSGVESNHRLWTFKPALYLLSYRSLGCTKGIEPWPGESHSPALPLSYGHQVCVGTLAELFARHTRSGDCRVVKERGRSLRPRTRDSKPTRKKARGHSPGPRPRMDASREFMACRP